MPVRRRIWLHLVDIVSPAKRSEMMSGIRSRNTKPEIAVRKLLHASGFRFRLHDKRYPAKPDILLPKWKTAVLVNGCFWHGHEPCPIFRLPKSRTEFWNNKIEANRARDARKINELQNFGFDVIVIWECSLRGPHALPLDVLNDALVTAVRSNGPPLTEFSSTQFDRK